MQPNATLPSEASRGSTRSTQHAASNLANRRACLCNVLIVTAQLQRAVEPPAGLGQPREGR